MGTVEKPEVGIVGKLRKISNVIQNRRASVTSSKLSIGPPRRLESIMDIADSKTNSEVIEIDKPDFCEVNLDFEVARL